MRVSSIVAAAALLVLASCGSGGGGGGQPGGGGNNSAPIFNSSGAASVAENAVTVFYTASATDADGDALSFNIAGGPDAARFSIAAQSGALSFVSAPDFERSGDANADNVYRVTLSVSDGSAAAQLDLTVTVTDIPGVVVVRRVVAGLAQPIFLTGVPDTPFAFIIERAGRIRVLDTSTGMVAPTPFLDVSSQVSTAGEQGLLGMALAPDFASSGVFYIHMSNTSGDTEIRRFESVPGELSAAVPTSSNLILTVDQPLATNHKGGWMGFGPDGLLYIALGDGGADASNGQNAANVFGAILRIDPSGDAFPADANRDYLIPPSNPFASGGGASEIWVRGLRNPFRASFDHDTGNLYIGDVGQDNVEEIDLARPSDGGANYGWNLFEGTQPYPPGSPAPPSVGLTPPIAEYPHGAGPLQGGTVTAGYVYRGPIASLRGHYFFGDFINDRIWSIWTGAITQGVTLSNTQFNDRTAAFVPDAGAISSPVSFGEDARGNLYIVDFDGEIFVVTEDD